MVLEDLIASSFRQLGDIYLISFSKQTSTSLLLELFFMTVKPMCSW